MTPTFKSLYILLAICLSAACEPVKTNDLSQTRCVMDETKIHPWIRFGELKMTTPPYMKTYEGCGKILLYIAASHGSDPESSTFKMVQRAFAQNAIEFALVEGFPSNFGFNDPKILEYAKSVKSKARDGEPYLTIRLAAENGADFQGGEPSEKDILRSLNDPNMRPVDLVGFYIVRQIPQLIRHKELENIKDPALDIKIERLLKNFVDETGISRSDLSDVDGVVAFRRWYETTNKMSFEENFRQQDSWPSTAISDPRPTNFMSDKVGNIRDQHIISVMNNAFKDNEVVLVVYGGSHHAIQEPAITTAFKEIQ